MRTYTIECTTCKGLGNIPRPLDELHPLASKFPAICTDCNGSGKKQAPYDTKIEEKRSTDSSGCYLGIPHSTQLDIGPEDTKYLLTTPQALTVDNDTTECSYSLKRDINWGVKSSYSKFPARVPEPDLIDEIYHELQKQLEQDEIYHELQKQLEQLDFKIIRFLTKILQWAKLDGYIDIINANKSIKNITNLLGAYFDSLPRPKYKHTPFILQENFDEIMYYLNLFKTEYYELYRAIGLVIFNRGCLFYPNIFYYYKNYKERWKDCSYLLGNNYISFNYLKDFFQEYGYI